MKVSKKSLKPFLNFRKIAKSGKFTKNHNGIDRKKKSYLVV